MDSKEYACEMLIRHFQELLDVESDCLWDDVV